MSDSGRASYTPKQQEEKKGALALPRPAQDDQEGSRQEANLCKSSALLFGTVREFVRL